MFLKYCCICLLVLNVISCTEPADKKPQVDDGVGLKTAVRVQGIIDEFSIDFKTISYAYGHQLRVKANRQVNQALNENQFINSFLEGKNSREINLQEVNQRLNEARRAQGQNPNGPSEISSLLGLYMGGNETGNIFLNKLSVADFANGFKDAQNGINSQGVNSDSLYVAEQNKFNEFIGKRFLEENKKLEGIVETGSGLQYKIITKGAGALPNENTEVTVHYTGALVTGKVFDSSVSRGQPISFNLQGVIKGWTEGLQLMPVGSKFRFFIPYELGYGAQATSSIPPYSTLIFDVELLSI